MMARELWLRAETAETIQNYIFDICNNLIAVEPFRRVLL